MTFGYSMAQHFRLRPYLPSVISGIILIGCVIYRRIRGVVFLQKNFYRQCKLALKVPLSHDTYVFRFLLPKNEVLGLDAGQHIFLRTCIDGKTVARPYTPVSSVNAKGYFDLLVKVYEPYGQKKGGIMTQYLKSLSTGSTLDVMGPKGKFVYHGMGKYGILNTEIRRCKRIGMIAGGTGITPMLQIIHAVLKDAKDKTTMYLLFSNCAKSDILCRSELDNLMEDSRFTVTYTLTKDFSKDKEITGRVDEPMISMYLPCPHADTLFLICGPSGLVRLSQQLLNRIGHDRKNIFSF